MGLVLLSSIGPFRYPGHIRTHAQFLKWLAKTEIPEEVRVGFFNGEVSIEAMPERAFAHNRIKTTIAKVLDTLVQEKKLGIYFGDGMCFVSEDFTCYPDGMFITTESLEKKKVWLTGAKEGEEDTQLRGEPDLTIEVVSDTSEYKDTAWFMSAYWNAGVSEYWIVDARQEPLKFAIHRRTPKGFVAVRKTAGWNRSPLLEHFFRFVPGEMFFGRRMYQLEVSEAAR